MLKSIGTTLLFLFFTLTIQAQTLNNSQKDSLISIVKAYYDLNVKVFQSDSKVEDIDNIFKLFTEDFTYIHPKYGGTYTRDDLYNGYVRNQKNGMYNSSIVAIKINKKITGLNAMVVERNYVKKEHDKDIEEESKMTLFEFKDGKISRIFEYW